MTDESCLTLGANYETELHSETGHPIPQYRDTETKED